MQGSRFLGRVFFFSEPFQHGGNTFSGAGFDVDALLYVGCQSLPFSCLVYLLQLFIM